MAIEQLPELYQTSDGRKYSSRKQAERHEAKITAKSKYEDARREYARTLSESQKTADGYLFDMSALGGYYYVTPGWFNMPDIRPVSFYYWNCDLNDQDETVIVDRDNGKGTRTEYKISELYWRRKNAEKALIVAWEKKIVELQEQLEEMRGKYRTNPATQE